MCYLILFKAGRMKYTSRDFEFDVLGDFRLIKNLNILDKRIAYKICLPIYRTEHLSAVYQIWAVSVQIHYVY